MDPDFVYEIIDTSYKIERVNISKLWDNGWFYFPSHFHSYLGFLNLPFYILEFKFYWFMLLKTSSIWLSFSNICGKDLQKYYQFSITDNYS